MHIPRIELIQSTLMNNLGQRMHIDQWLRIINDNLPSPKKVNKRSVVNLIKGCRGISITREKVKGNVIYEFDRLE